MHLGQESNSEMASNKPKKQTNDKSLCFCKTLLPCLFMIKLIGICPLIVIHEQGRCVFKKSNIGLAWCICVVILYALQILFTTELLNIFTIAKGKSIHALLSAINDIIYSVYVLLLTILNIVQYSSFAKTMNHISPILKEGLFCQSARKMMRRIQYGFLAALIAVLGIQYAAITWLHFSSSYQTNFDYRILIFRFIQNIPFVFYILFFCACTMFVALLICFEKLTINVLKFTPVHPMKGIDETNNKQDFFGIIKYTMCKEEHVLSNQLLRAKPAEQVEYLRILHEDICTIMYEVNNCLNPQLLCHTVVELTVLIVHWYAVIIYIAFDFATEAASTIHFLNCLFAFLHTLGLFIFLRNAQQMWNIVSERMLIIGLFLSN